MQCIQPAVSDTAACTASVLASLSPWLAGGGARPHICICHAGHATIGNIQRGGLRQETPQNCPIPVADHKADDDALLVLQRPQRLPGRHPGLAQQVPSRARAQTLHAWFRVSSEGRPSPLYAVPCPLQGCARPWKPVAARVGTSILRSCTLCSLGCQDARPRTETAGEWSLLRVGDHSMEHTMPATFNPTPTLHARPHPPRTTQHARGVLDCNNPRIAIIHGLQASTPKP